jgi:hypothetical protein
MIKFIQKELFRLNLMLIIDPLAWFHPPRASRRPAPHWKPQAQADNMILVCSVLVWVMASCGLVGTQKAFRRRILPTSSRHLPRGRRQNVLPKRCYPPIILRDIISRHAARTA